VTDSDCSESLTTTVSCTVPQDALTIVAASVETTPVPDSDDAADDPAVWVNPTTPALSVVIGTDKQGGGLGVYGLDGDQIQYLPSGKLNNVDLRDGFQLDGVFVTQDDSNDGLNQNFKLVPLEHILTTAPWLDDSACGGGGSGGGTGGASGIGGSSAGGGAASTGYGEPFCTMYCNKCAECYTTGSFSEGDCVFQHAKTAFTLEDCQAGCAVSATPGAAAKAALSTGFQSLSCADFDGAI
jgi:Phytase